MKNTFLFQPRTSFTKAHLLRYLFIALFFFLGAQQHFLQAQAKLSIQGILKKASGDAVTDGSYDLTFKLYTVESGGTAVWDEIQNDVDVVNGIYSTVLGNDSLLTIPFNQIYYLGVKVGSTEMSPRVQLTSAPYALSLIGTTNVFPSSGIVKADSIRINGTAGAQINTGVLARGGAPGANGASKNGYAFNGNNGDKDSGLFSTGTGQVSLYSDNVKILTATPDSVAIRSDLRLKNEGNINYNGLNDWRLVETDYFETGSEGWNRYNTWDDITENTAPVLTFPGAFAGNALTSNNTGQVFKKLFTLPGSSVTGTYTYVKVVFNYFYLDSWDLEAGKKGWAGFSQTEDCAALRIGWVDERAWTGYGIDNIIDPGGAFNVAANFSGSGGSGAYSDQWVNEEMVGRYPSGAGNSDFWVIFGARTLGEYFGVSMIEIWVK